jgi:hypothetical protein
MKTRDEQLVVARRICDEALSGNLDLESFYVAVGEIADFSDFPRVVVADVLDFIEHETEGQEWQKHDVLIDRLLLDKAATDELRIAARTALRKNLRADTDVPKQVDLCLERLAVR